jgi:hypothetical protein
MALTNKPNKSKYQVGETVHFLSNGKGTSAQIVKVSSSVSNPDNDTNGIQENIYYLEGFAKGFAETELFHSMNALIFNIKGNYLNTWEVAQLNFTTVGSNLDLSYSDFTAIDFVSYGPLSFQQAKLDGCNFSEAILQDCDLSNCSMRNCILVSTAIMNVNFSGADLTDSILDQTYNTKAQFKTAVGTGNWTGTVWVDGTILT